MCWALVRRVETPLLVLCDTSLSASLKLKLDMSNGVKLTKKETEQLACQVEELLNVSDQMDDVVKNKKIKR